MREGSPSLTAQRVATYRLGFERLPAPSGDGSADERLARDVAGSSASGFVANERMARYLRGRTAFFDRVVVNGLGRGVAQMAAIGAGYDGRALRYAKPGVRWFELEPAERERLAAAIAARPLVFHAWGVATGREQLPVMADELPALTERAQKIAARALRTLDEHR